MTVFPALVTWPATELRGVPNGFQYKQSIACWQWPAWCIEDVAPAVHLDGSGQWRRSIRGTAFDEIVVVRGDVALPWLPHDQTLPFFSLVSQVLCEHMKETLHYLFPPRTSFSNECVHTDGQTKITKFLFFNRCTVYSGIHTVHSPTDAHLWKNLITFYIKIRWLLHISVYYHHQGACNWVWLKLYWY